MKKLTKTTQTATRPSSKHHGHAWQIFLVLFCTVSLGLVRILSEQRILHAYYLPVVDQHSIPNRPQQPYRFLLGIFSMDSDSESALRRAHRETYLSYFNHPNVTDPKYSNPKTICSLNEFLDNFDKSFAHDPTSCLLVYTYVMGGGNPATKPTICYWGNQTCGGGDTSFNYVRNTESSIATTSPPNTSPEVNFSRPEELQKYQDITFLNIIRENLAEGKTETWFTYAASLTKERPELSIQAIFKVDSDTVVMPRLLLGEVDNTVSYNRLPLYTNSSAPFYYGGSPIKKFMCKGKKWGTMCSHKNGFKAPLFMVGMAYFRSTPLAQHVFLDDGNISLAEKASRFIPDHEDTSLGNTVYLAKQNITVISFPFRLSITFAHPFKDPKKFVEKYWRRVWKYCLVDNETAFTTL